jgi:hypothetical protein
MSGSEPSSAAVEDERRARVDAELSPTAPPTSDELAAGDIATLPAAGRAVRTPPLSAAVVVALQRTAGNAKLLTHLNTHGHGGPSSSEFHSGRLPAAAGSTSHDAEIASGLRASAAKRHIAASRDQREANAPRRAAQLDIEIDPLITINGLPSMSLEDFRASCQQARGQISDEYDAAEGKIEGYAIQYSTAWLEFSEHLSAADAAERLVGDQITRGMLAFIPGGMGGVAGGWVRSKKLGGMLGDFMIDGVKDLLKDSLRRGGEEFLQPPTYVPLGADPVDWRGTAMQNLKRERAFVGSIVTFWLTKANARSSAFPLNFDPAKTIDETVRAEGRKYSAAPDAGPKDASLAEKGLWKTWVEQHRFHLQEVQSGAGISYQVGDRAPAQLDAMGGLPAYRAGKVIRARLQILGEALDEDADFWMEQWGADSRRKLIAQRDKLNEDAPGSGVKRFLEWLTD